MFHTNLVRAPAQFFLSKSDRIGAEASNQRVRESWESMGIQVRKLFIFVIKDINDVNPHNLNVIERRFSHIYLYFNNTRMFYPVNE